MRNGCKPKTKWTIEEDTSGVWNKRGYGKGVGSASIGERNQPVVVTRIRRC